MEHREHPPHPGYETRDANARPLVITGATIVGVTALVIVVLRGMLVGMERVEPIVPVVKEEARLEDNPFTNLYAQNKQLRRDEAHALDGYSYDAKSGVATIPIDRAMDLIAQRGVPKGKGPKTEIDVIRRGHAPGGGEAKKDGETKNDQ